MTVSYPRLGAAAFLFVGGAVLGFLAFAIVVTRAAIAFGLPAAIGPADVALLDDLVQLMPFVGAFAAAHIVAGNALVNGSSWADRLATTLSAAAVAVGLLAIVLLILGQDPFAAVASNRALDGLGILGTSVVLYGAVIAALALDRDPVARAATRASA